MHIWILDDSPSDAMLVELALAGTGLSVTSERMMEGAEVLQRIQDGGVCPDLIIMDVNLPRMDAVELVGIMRLTPAFANQKVLVMSSHVGPAVRAELLKLGVERVIQKPNDLKIFRQTIGDAVREIVD